ncbi:50S ribosomal protein L29 [Candidatus Peregrinibacteria bacterium]|nr:50S ribosomal protein L29 [Candidatus Peregrinibacteria bacterium]
METLEELRKLEVNKLLESLKNSEKELSKVKFEVKNGQSKNSHMIENYKKHVARIKTVIKEKQEVMTEIKEDSNTQE